MAEYRFPKSAPSDMEAIKLKHLAKISRIPYSKVRNCVTGLYSSLTDSERTTLFNNLIQETEKAAAALGFTMDGRRIKAKD